MMAIVIKTFPNAHTRSMFVFSFHGNPHMYIHLPVNTQHLYTTETRTLSPILFLSRLTLGQFRLHNDDTTGWAYSVFC